MKTALEPPLRAEQDDVLHALVSIVATTRRHWELPPERCREATPGAGIGPESFSAWPWPGTARINGSRRRLKRSVRD